MSNEQDVLAALEAWAETDGPVTENGSVTTGAEAKQAGRALAKKVRRGKPNLGQKHATGQGRSPRLQVRLSPETARQIETLALETGTNSSTIMRVAIDQLLQSPNAKEKIKETV